MLGDGNQVPLNYRYAIQPQEKINAFKPKELDPAVSSLGIRSAALGAYYHKKYNQLPTCEWLQTVWEAISFKVLGG